MDPGSGPPIEDPPSTSDKPDIPKGAPACSFLSSCVMHVDKTIYGRIGITISIFCSSRGEYCLLLPVPDFSSLSPAMYAAALSAVPQIHPQGRLWATWMCATEHTSIELNSSHIDTNCRLSRIRSHTSTPKA